MKAKKLTRFAAIKTFQNVFEFPENMQDGWQTFFKNDNPIVLELACGKGEYTVNMAKNFPEKNFIGIDIKGNRMFVGAQKALQENITNVCFLRIRIENILQYFKHQSIDEIWITFPDPFLRESRAKNRLTHHKFLAMYQQILKEKGIIHLKTDSKELYDFTQEMVAHHQCTIVQNIQDVYKNGEPAFPLNIKTFYETMHLADNRTIQYISFCLPNAPIKVPPKKQKNEESLI
ncbi:MAG: tRNA (guanosine(46)-N7)-methyltransferase TrmB [Chitinophagaceae bacterium]|nr:tRNA (guanosine(46)-N7)-methyltransferase TrmB [Chitinophagaceae bacterium]HMN31808.1 tRNA (guanosine(46)-N7)-methyltransferase TrmB [Chitinophagaceae bacterium]